MAWDTTLAWFNYHLTWHTEANASQIFVPISSHVHSGKEIIENKWGEEVPPKNKQI